MPLLVLSSEDNACVQGLVLLEQAREMGYMEQGVSVLRPGRDLSS